MKPSSVALTIASESVSPCIAFATDFGLQDTLQLGEGVWGSLALGAGDGASYLPRWRADGFLYRKFGPTQRWIGSLGLGHYRAPDGYRDQNLTLGLSYWFESPWVLQAEWRHNRSHPGNIDTRQYALAASWGQAGQTQMTLRHGWGREGYQVRGEGNTVVNFASHETSLNLQHWLAPDWGLRAGAVRYRAQGQRRDGVAGGAEQRGGGRGLAHLTGKAATASRPGA